MKKEEEEWLLCLILLVRNVNCPFQTGSLSSDLQGMPGEAGAPGEVGAAGARVSAGSNLS